MPNVIPVQSPAWRDHARREARKLVGRHGGPAVVLVSEDGSTWATVRGVAAALAITLCVYRIGGTMYRAVEIVE